MIETPLIKKLPSQNGRVYVFSSAIQDLNLNVGEETNKNKFKFSKFALLKIPEFNERGLNKNTVKMLATQSGTKTTSQDDESLTNSRFAESFQNYCLNLETSLLNNESYNNSLSDTVAERVFFKWLKELTAIRFVKAQDRLGVDMNNYYMEEKNSSNYSRVVKYIGNISLVDQIQSSVENYIQIQIHIPEYHGSTPTVLFKSKSDDNYYPGMNIGRTGLDKELIYGINSGDMDHPDNLKVNALYDSTFQGASDDNIPGFGQIELYRKISQGLFGNETIFELGELNTSDYTGTSPNNWWFNTALSRPYSYLTEPTDTYTSFENDLLAVFLNQGSATGDDINNPVSGAVKFIRNKLDGVSLEFDINPYQEIFEGVKNFSEVNSWPNSDDFEFNAILLYYDIYTRDLETGVETVHSTNLYGVYFLNNVTEPAPNSTQDYPKIASYLKTKPKFGVNGFSYSFNLNLKLTNRFLDTDVNVVNPFNDTIDSLALGSTFSADMFMRAINEMRIMTEAILTERNDLTLNTSKVLSLESNLSSLNLPVEQLDTRVKYMEKIVNSVPFITSIQSSSKMSELLLSLSNDLKAILNGKTTTNIEFNWDNLKAKSGIKVEKFKDTKEVLLTNTTNSYTLGDVLQADFPFDWTSNAQYYDYTFKLNAYTNYYRINSIKKSEYTDNTTLKNTYPKKDFRIFIDDSSADIDWVTGQVFKLYFVNELLFLNPIGTDEKPSLISIYTDAKNKLRNPTKYSKLIGTIKNTDFNNIFEKKYVEIICVDSDNLDFILEIPN